MDIAALNAEYGLSGQVRFRQGTGGLVLLDVSNSLATATIALQGAQLLTWAPRSERAVVWVSPQAKYAAGKSVRGGVPVCWPWFGPHATEAGFPSHGFARTVPWDIVTSESLANGATRLLFRLPQQDSFKAQWPHPCELQLGVTVGSALDMDLTTRNSGQESIVVGDALHTYFSVSDVREIAIHGLGGCEYIDKVADSQRKQQSGPIHIEGETDRIYLDSVADCLIDDPRWKRRIRIAKHGSRSTVVWNPWVEKAIKLGDMGEQGYLDMVCVESTNAADDVVTIAAGETHRLAVHYRVEYFR
jgi:glucose-6-phosphate 1-epimerase